MKSPLDIATRPLEREMDSLAYHTRQLEIALRQLNAYKFHEGPSLMDHVAVVWNAGCRGEGLDQSKEPRK